MEFWFRWCSKGWCSGSMLVCGGIFSRGTGRGSEIGQSNFVVGTCFQDRFLDLSTQQKTGFLFIVRGSFWKFWWNWVESSFVHWIPSVETVEQQLPQCWTVETVEHILERLPLRYCCPNGSSLQAVLFGESMALGRSKRTWNPWCASTHQCGWIIHGGYLGDHPRTDISG